MHKDLQIVTDSEGDSEDYITEEETGKPEEKKKPKNKKLKKSQSTPKRPKKIPLWKIKIKM